VLRKTYLLDTNILSDLVRNPSGSIAQKIQEVGESSVFTSIIVSSELRFSAKKKNSARLTSQVEAILSVLLVLNLENPVDKHYAELRTQLEAFATPIGPNDMLIAAHALSLDAILVTANESEFRRVSGLRVENWLR